MPALSIAPALVGVAGAGGATAGAGGGGAAGAGAPFEPQPARTTQDTSKRDIMTEH
jgi:hypothetical protein